MRLFLRGATWVAERSIQGFPAAVAPVSRDAQVIHLVTVHYPQLIHRWGKLSDYPRSTARRARVRASVVEVPRLSSY